jgi:hypothetical protein
MKERDALLLLCRIIFCTIAVEFVVIVIVLALKAILRVPLETPLVGR